MKRAKILLAVALFSLMASWPVSASAERRGAGPNPGVIAVDVALVRPLAFVGSVASTAVYLALLPISFPTGTSHEAAMPMVLATWRFTSARYIGRWNEYKDGGDIWGSRY